MNARVAASSLFSTPNASIPEPEFIIVSKCVTLEITHPFMSHTISKEELGVIVVTIDMVIVLCFLIFI